ncbi:hypothetical protein SAMN04487996_11222 [Dyadobacter soli]|uniref:Outer membrane protein beta-barrel domain-containing protein n=1 Tax=Dyadobacter soli TaxID=659014 RepID=A0A1G7NDR8_9BACT|nr:hypothetical protein [Dyadobacter soli]SDF72096.1 hypothetical protein SAMN04487996_11222 [Dyadobacter soli]
MKIFYLLIFVLASATGHAQWKANLGVNIPPVIGSPAEISSEFTRHPGYSLNFNLGHTFKTGHTGLINYNVYDGVSERKTSGTFLKAGARIYPISFSGKQRRNHFFIGAFLVLSQYRQTALKRELSEDLVFGDSYTPISAKGVVLFPAATIGFQNRLGKSLLLDWGVQKSFVIREGNYLGSRMRNYQPGAGSPQSDPWIGYFQGVLSLKYQFAH